ncbi:hypothetical protein [Streptomyces pseudovenezuelae]|uniref:Uncharacterized protein n=1 Tax=Streptomyces pseudovenezuelae TaxID=67350 RepID=A0ABT6LU36_9ACTN|nr:hypothetical protein [Streptomyces pseudovenezuelae]MDH6219221.1 hypothetical protein [Streptomyces pseudovenezuelae]
MSSWSARCGNWASDSTTCARQVVQTVAAVRERGLAPGTPQAAETLETGIEARAEDYRRLVARVRGQNSAPDATSELEWLARTLRATAQT